MAWNKVKKYFKNVWNVWNTIPCHVCRHKEFGEQATYWDERGVVEKEIKCKKCLVVVNIWAYGYYEEPATKTEWMCRNHKWYRTLYKFCKKVYGR